MLHSSAIWYRTLSFENFANNFHTNLNQICDLLRLISHRLPDTGGFIPAIVMRFIISENSDGWKLIVLNILERRPYLKQKFCYCLIMSMKRAQLVLLIYLFFFEMIYNIIYKKIYQLTLLVRRNVVVLLPVTLTDVARWIDRFAPTRDPHLAKDHN